MNLTRYIQKIFASNSAADQIRKFGSLAAGSPANATTPAEVQELANYLGGWPSAVLGNNSPALEDMNALQYLFSYQLSYLMQKGVPEWETGTTYYTGDIARNSSGVLFVSLTDDNQGNALTDASNWKPWTPNEWVSGVTYGSGDKVFYNGVWYISRQAANQGNTPAAVSLWWRIDNGKVIGEYVDVPFTTAPNGTIYCNGAPISRTTYADLFTAIGTNFGDGSENADGTSSGFSGTHFNLPDFRGEVSRYQDDGRGADPNAGTRVAQLAGGAIGDNIGSKQADATAPNSLSTGSAGSHQHTLKGGYTNTSASIAGNNYDGTNEVSGGSGSTFYDLNQAAVVSNGDHTHSITGDDETRMRNLYGGRRFIVF